MKKIGNIFWSTRGLSREDITNENDNFGVLDSGEIMEVADRVWKEKLVSYDYAFNLAFTPDSETILNGDSRHNHLDGDGLAKLKQSKWDSVQGAKIRLFQL